MSSKKRLIFKVATLLVAYAAIIPRNSSPRFIGEPQLPKKIQKNDTI